jgi:hypothetical protein
MRTISHSLAIAAPAATVWRVLTDFAAYPEWNPFIREISGELREGARLTVRIAPPGRSAMTFRPRVLEVAPPRAFRWLGHLFIPGIFDGEHRFRIEPLQGQCRFTQEEEFRGVLASLVLHWIGAATERGFAAMNEALKSRAEAWPGPG